MRHVTPLLALVAFMCPLVLRADDFAGLKSIDPEGDCTIESDAGTLAISVPGTPHDLSIELGIMNAPRALRRVSGDFIAEVKVAGTLEPAGATIPQRTAFQASGLLLIQDPRTYIRLERAAIARPGKLVRYVSFEARDKSRIIASHAEGLRDDDDLWLRIERRGDTTLGAISSDGKKWMPLDPIDIEFTETLSIGVAALNASDKRFDTQFEHFRLFLPDKPKTPGEEAP